MLHARVAQSDDPEGPGAARALIDQLMPDLERYGAPRLLFVWATMGLDHAALLEGLAEFVPPDVIIGCTADGEAGSGELGFAQNSVVVMSLWGDALDVGIGLGRRVSANPSQAAQRAVGQARQSLRGEPRLALAFPDSLTTSGVAIVDGLVAALGPDVTLLGATAADQHVRVQTRQFVGREVLSDALPVVLFGHGVMFSHGVASGWNPLGRKATVTRARGNVVYEVDGAPALEFYRRYFGPQSTPRPEQPLAVFESSDDTFYLRAPRDVCDDGALVFLGDVPEGATVQLTDVDRDDVVRAARTSVDMALRQLDHEPTAALVFSCAARRVMLGTRSADEHREIQRVLGPRIPFAGFYSFGEIGPTVRDGTARFHNETFITVLLAS